MSGFKNFALAGVGSLGSVVLDELLSAKVAGKVDKVVILSRPDSVSKLDAYASRGATISSIADYSDVANVAKALAGIDVVISTLGHSAFGLQVPIAEAAKSQGVRLFILSEWGMSTDGITEGMLGFKVALVKQIREIIPATLFFTGGFGDWFWIPFLHLDLKSGKVAVGGDGKAKMSLTSRPDIARFVVYVLTTLAPEETSNKTFRIEAEHTSFNEIFKTYEAKHGTKLDVTYMSLDELRANEEKNPQDFAIKVHIAWATGAGIVGSPLDNDKFPEWNPSPVIEYI